MKLIRSFARERVSFNTDNQILLALSLQNTVASALGRVEFSFLMKN